MKKTIKVFAFLMAAALMVVSLAGCNSKSDADQKDDTNVNLPMADSPTPDTDVQPTPVSEITDFQAGQAELHEVILPWTFEEGEEIENPYYKRTTDENGTLVYAVMKASNNQVAYLPAGSTVVYVGGDGDCYYEKTTNTYKLDGEEKTSEQYQLYIVTDSQPVPLVPDASDTGSSDASSQEPVEDNSGGSDASVSSVS